MHCMEKVLRDVRTLVGDFGTLPGAEISGEKRVRDGSEVGPFWTILTVGGVGIVLAVLGILTAGRGLIFQIRPGRF